MAVKEKLGKIDADLVEVESLENELGTAIDQRNERISQLAADLLDVANNATINRLLNSHLTGVRDIVGSEEAVTYPTNMEGEIALIAFPLATRNDDYALVIGEGGIYSMLQNDTIEYKGKLVKTWERRKVASVQDLGDELHFFSLGEISQIVSTLGVFLDKCDASLGQQQSAIESELSEIEHFLHPDNTSQRD